MELAPIAEPQLILCKITIFIQINKIIFMSRIR